MKATIPFFLLLIFSGFLNYAQPGSLDITYGTGGKVTTLFPTGNTWVSSIAFQQNGKIIMAGVSPNVSMRDAYTLGRYNTNGSIDSTFGRSGFCIGDSISISHGANAVAIGNNDAIIIAGYANVSGVTNSSQLMCAKYRSEGILDSSFGSNGIVLTSSGLGQSETTAATALAIQSDGKIIAAGYTGKYGLADHSFVVRYNTDGSVDGTFAGGGADSSIHGDAISVIIQPDHKILIGGTLCNMNTSNTVNFCVLRLDSNGFLDNTFGLGGIATYYSELVLACSMALQADGKIILGGRTMGSNANFALVRFNSDGSVDNNFGSNGIGIFDLTGTDDFPRSVALQADGKILFAGCGGLNFGLIRCNTDGEIDSTFGNNGMVSTNFNSTSHANAMKVQNDGKILLAGDNFSANGGAFSSARYLSDVNTSVINLTNFKARIYPNPVLNDLSIEYINQANEVLILVITDGIGKKIRSIETPILGGKSKQIKHLDVSNLAPDIYYVTFIINEKRQTMKFVKE